MAFDGFDDVANFASLEAYSSIAARRLEREIVLMLDHERLGVLVRSPIVGGLFSGKVTRGRNSEQDTRRAALPFSRATQLPGWQT